MIKTGNENIQDMNKQIASLTQKLEEARQESKLKDVYLHNICHEIRNPLNAVVGFAQLVSLPDDIVSQKEKEEYNDYITQNSSLLMLVVDDILNISDIKSGNYKISKAPAPLNNIGVSVIASVKYRVTDKVKLIHIRFRRFIHARHRRQKSAADTHQFPHQCHKAYVRGKHRAALLA